jgi:hypothetical protein
MPAASAASMITTRSPRDHQLKPILTVLLGARELELPTPAPSRIVCVNDQGKIVALTEVGTSIGMTAAPHGDSGPVQDDARSSAGNSVSPYHNQGINP